MFIFCTACNSPAPFSSGSGTILPEKILYFVGDVVTYTCTSPTSHIQEGTKKATCQHDGTFLPNTGPSCEQSISRKLICIFLSKYAMFCPHYEELVAQKLFFFLRRRMDVL